MQSPHAFVPVLSYQLRRTTFYESKTIWGEMPLTAIPAWDKVVLNAIKMVLEPIYEGLSSLVPEQDPKGESNPSTNTGPQASQETADTVLPSDSKRSEGRSESRQR